MNCPKCNCKISSQISPEGIVECLNCGSVLKDRGSKLTCFVIEKSSSQKKLRDIIISLREENESLKKELDSNHHGKYDSYLFGKCTKIKFGKINPVEGHFDHEIQQEIKRIRNLSALEYHRRIKRLMYMNNINIEGL